MATTSQVTHEINQVLRDLVAARDEARVRAHLLGAEARERLSDLELEIENFERKLSARGDWIAEHVIATARGLTRAIGDLLVSRPEHEPTRVRDVMSRELRTCLPSDSLNVAAQQMWEGDCGALPVVDHDGRALGMLTDRDICMAAYTRGLALGEIAVSSAMSAHVFSCRPSDSLRSLMSAMASRQVRRVPVVDDADKVIGIVSLADIARLAQAPTVLSHEARIWVPGMLAGISAKPANQQPS
ncbi:MAG TPA: CBS domain-containing protein [Polyangiaceae bacterium]|nr:CBS domain-containing protein [Polyangiaceae bacterium]